MNYKIIDKYNNETGNISSRNNDKNNLVFVKRKSFIKTNKNRIININEKIKPNFSNDKEKYKYLKNENKEIEINCYNENIMDISCIKYCNLGKLIKIINFALKENKINYNMIKENVFQCWKYDKFFEIEIFYLKTDKENEFDKKNKKCSFLLEQKNCFYLKIKSKKGNIKGFLSNFFKEILI